MKEPEIHNIITKTLSLHEGAISSFTVEIGYAFSMESAYFSKWILLLSKSDIECLELVNFRVNSSLIGIYCLLHTQYCEAAREGGYWKAASLDKLLVHLDTLFLLWSWLLYLTLFNSKRLLRAAACSSKLLR